MRFSKNKNLIKILIIGKNSFLAKGYYKYSSLKKKITLVNHNQIENINYKKFTHLINFSYDKKIFDKIYCRTNLIDKRICNLIDNDRLIYIYPSSRTVFKTGKKEKRFKKRKIYGKNKLFIEKIIKQYRKKRYLILRIPNLIELNLKEQNFISKVLYELKTFEVIKIDLHKKTYKDFIPLYFFSKCLDKLIELNTLGTMNISSGQKIYIYELCKAIIKGFGKGKIIYLKKLYIDSFVLNNSKLKKITKIFITKKEILNYCYMIGRKLNGHA